jgi:hypothetical protein
MGAVQFEDSAFAKSLSEAFSKAVKQACYDHGHSGYTGTIAEKGDYIVVPRRPRVTAAKIIDTISQAYFAAALNDTKDPWYREDKAADKAFAQLVEWYGQTAARQFVRTYNDKWGPCIAIEASAAETAAYKKRWGIGVHVSYDSRGTMTKTVKRVHGKLYYFAGWASS